MPVESRIGRAVPRVWRSKAVSVSDADAILKQGTSKREMKSTEGSSQHEANQGILISRQ